MNIPAEALDDILCRMQDCVTDSEAQIIEEAAIAAGYYKKCPECEWVDLCCEDVCSQCKSPHKEI